MSSFKINIKFLSKYKRWVFIFSIVVLGCKNEKDKSRIKAVIPICNQYLFVEKYLISGQGAFGGDLMSAYLTDSTNFRKYLFTYDNAHESISVDCKGEGSVLITKLIQDTTTLDFKIESTTIYRVSDLKKEKIFE
jgi:hypothetical protein